MKQLFKFFVVPTVIAVVSLISTYIKNENCQCQTNKNFTSTSVIFESGKENQSYEEKTDYFSEPKEEVSHKNSNKNHKEVENKPKYWFHHPGGPEYHFIFETVEKVLNRLNFQKIEMDLSKIHYDWDILWSYQMHDLEKFQIDWEKLKFYQKINHIPGNHYITSKSVFGTTTRSKYVPKAFTSVDKLREYSKNYPEKRFVMKLKSNRGVQLKKVSEMNFTENENLMDYFAQEFIDNPLLFNGHKFDFAIYVVITSVQPLRFYYYTKNMIFRFCPKTYDLTDPYDYDRYVVSDSKIPVWKFNGTKKYFENGYNTKDAFEGFLRSIGVDVGEIWKKIENCIREILMIKEKHFIEWIELFKTIKHNHFELIRFDMILDTNLDIHVIEINQHPNLYPADHFKQNQYLYENLLYNLFNLIGVGTTFNKENLRIPSMEVEKMIAEQHSVNVQPEVCVSDMCQRSCSEACAFCRRCLNGNDLFEQLQAYREQMNLGDFKRLFPPEQDDFENVEADYWSQVSHESREHANWFTYMCERNRNFC